MSQEPMNNMTPRAQQVLALARKQSDKFHHNYVGTEHVILGIIRLGQGVAVNVLQRMAIDLEALRVRVEGQVGPMGESQFRGSIPYTPRVKKVLALAGKESKTLNHAYVGTEHILLGLLREAEGIAARTLREFDVDIEKTRIEILRELDGKPAAASSKVEDGLPQSTQGPRIVAGLADRVVNVLKFNPQEATTEEVAALESTALSVLREMRVMRPVPEAIPHMLDTLDGLLETTRSQTFVSAVAEVYANLAPGTARDRLRAQLQKPPFAGMRHRNFGTALQILNDGKPVSFEIDFLRQW